MNINKREFTMVRQAPAVGKIQSNVLFDGIGRCIEHCYILRSVPITTDTMYKAKEEIADYVMKRYMDLTLGEIGMALDMGARGELGNKDTFANIANMESWIRTYAECQQRADLLDEIRQEQKAKAQLPEPTDEERNEAMYRQRIPELMAYYREHGDIMVPAREQDARGIHTPAFGAVLYDMMVEHGDAHTPGDGVMEVLVMQAAERRKEYFAHARFRVGEDSIETFVKCQLLKVAIAEKVNRDHGRSEL